MPHQLIQYTIKDRKFQFVVNKSGNNLAHFLMCDSLRRGIEYCITVNEEHISICSKECILFYYDSLQQSLMFINSKIYYFYSHVNSLNFY